MTTRSKFLGSLLVPVAAALVLGVGAPAHAGTPTGDENHAPGAYISDGGPKLPAKAHHGKKPAKKAKVRVVRSSASAWSR